MTRQTSMFDDQTFDASWPQGRKNKWAAAGAAAYREKTASPTPILAPPSPAWPDPKPLPDGLLAVATFDADFLPVAIRPWVADIAGRMQCPMDFVAVAAMIALGSVLGRKVAIRPKAKSDWLEVGNLWGCVVGRPGAMKSPAMAEALKPLHRLESAARKKNEAAMRDYALAVEVHKLTMEEAGKAARAAIKTGGDAAALLAVDAPQEPQARRYVINDATYEKLGEILAHNPAGVLAFRDELVSLLKSLDQEQNAGARGFYLSAWNGTGGYTFDRIIRGQTHIEACCLSLLGSTQPARLGEYMRRMASGAGDDGLVQRFGLLVWPDQSPEWRNVDAYPNTDARQAAWSAFDRLNDLDAHSVGATCDNFDVLPFLRFDASAQGIFNEWHADLEKRLRSGELSPALESHLSKYRKLVPSLSLIAHLADGGSGAIGQAAILRALALAEYLETHARRAYAAGSENETQAAKAILRRIRRGELADGFTARDVHQHQWSGLTDKDGLKAGLDLLDDLGWLAARTEQTGGRPRVVFAINPRATA